ncbi:MAG TPA: DNA/RNA nuclease SfsA [Candidatus Acidoferrum sp.]|nr:DNA/RNA nuclease SfsA [Candidatus Acidoferrum sp.]
MGPFPPARESQAAHRSAIGIHFSRPLIAGRFLRRLNRFAALVAVNGKREPVHVRNSGRLRELLRPGRPVLLEPAATPGRRTRCTLAIARLPGGDVSADAHLPNALVEEGLRRRGVPGFGGYRLVRREFVIGQNRVDFLLARGERKCLLEVKSATLVEGGVALFPDAPTERGRKHLEHLVAARRHGLLAAVLFVVQRGDATAFAPNEEADREFADTLRRAVRAGVRVRAVRCRVTPEGVWLDRSLPVRWPARRPHPQRD